MERYSKDRFIPGGVLSAKRKTVKEPSPAHPHDFFELEYIINGDGTYNVDGVQHKIKGGMLFLMTPISFHSINTDRCELYNVMFSEKLCDVEALSFITLKGSLAIEVREDDRAFIESTLGELCRVGNHGNYSSYLLNALLCKLKSYIESEGVLPEAHPIVAGTFYIISHFRDNPTLADVAAYVGFTPTYFSALFKKETGTGFKEYLDRLRFEYAKKLTENTDMSVMEIAAESGFDDYPNFIRRFKARFGCTVLEMRSLKSNYDAR